MFHFNKESRLGRGVLLAAVVAGAAAFAVPAMAGECPADQKKPNAREAVDLKPVGVTDTVDRRDRREQGAVQHRWP